MHNSPPADGYGIKMDNITMSDDDKEYKKKLDTLSESFCSAKWYNATIWLGSGMTTSCHHPPAHKIPDEFLTNPKLIHNTPEKKADRAMMQRGERPSGCDYCWKVQDMKDTDAVPDRVYKSKIYDWKDNKVAYNSNPEQDVNLKTLEISFDRTCNFACSYCNPAFSTTWAKDIKENGAYTDLITDGRNHFTHSHESAQLFKPKDTNPYVEAFFKWWESDLKSTLDELRITGGEPSMSRDFWRILDLYEEHYHINNINGIHRPALEKQWPKFAFNTNLGMSDEQWKTLIDKLRGIGVESTMYTSCEATGAHAEYIRDGLNWGQWISRLDHSIEEYFVDDISVMCTVNALCLWTLPELLDHILMMRKKYDPDFLQPSFTLNILRFPSFQSCLVLPEEIRKRRRQALEGWLWSQDPKLLHEHEIDHIERLISYLREPEPIDVEAKRHDFKKFYTQYDLRRGKLFEDTFPEELVEWYKKIT